MQHIRSTVLLSYKQMKVTAPRTVIQVQSHSLEPILSLCSAAVKFGPALKLQFGGFLWPTVRTIWTLIPRNPETDLRCYAPEVKGTGGC